MDDTAVRHLAAVCVPHLPSCARRRPAQGWRHARPGIERPQHDFRTPGCRSSIRIPGTRDDRPDPRRADHQHGIRPALLAVLGAATLLLLIACANVMNLLLARARTAARRVLGSRALGAGRRRSCASCSRESLAADVPRRRFPASALRSPACRLLVAIAPSRLPRLSAIRVNGPALGFTLLVASLVGVAFGLVPAGRPRTANCTSDSS